MPFQVNLINGETLKAGDYHTAVHHDKLRCPDCDAPMVFRRATEDGSRRAHFAHIPDALDDHQRECSRFWQGMSEAHKEALQTLLTAPLEYFPMLSQAKAVTEKPLGDKTRRADVFYQVPESSYQVAFEAQYSQVTLSELQRRTNDYHRNGVYVVWCFGPRFDQAMHTAVRELWGCSGRLNADGTEVTFIGRLDFSVHPMEDAQKRKHLLVEQEQQRQEQQRQQLLEQERQRQQRQEQQRQQLLEQQRQWQEQQRQWQEQQRQEQQRQEQLVFDAYLWSDNEKDIEYAHMLCEAADLDYATERARVTAERLAAARKVWNKLKAAAEQPEEAML